MNTDRERLVMKAPALCFVVKRSASEYISREMVHKKNGSFFKIVFFILSKQTLNEFS